MTPCTLREQGRLNDLVARDAKQAVVLDHRDLFQKLERGSTTMSDKQVLSRSCTVFGAGQVRLLWLNILLLSSCCVGFCLPWNKSFLMADRSMSLHWIRPCFWMRVFPLVTPFATDCVPFGMIWSGFVTPRPLVWWNYMLRTQVPQAHRSLFASRRNR